MDGIAKPSPFLCSNLGRILNIEFILIIIKIEEVESIGRHIIGLLGWHDLLGRLGRDRHAIESLSTLVRLPVDLHALVFAVK